MGKNEYKSAAISSFDSLNSKPNLISRVLKNNISLEKDFEE